MRRVAGVCVAVFLVVAACGGSSSSTLSKDDFVKQGNSICQKGNDTINSSASSLFTSSSQPDPATMKKFFDETLEPSVKKQIDDIDNLKPPKELQAQVDKLVADARAALAKLKTAVATDPSAAFSSDDPFADVNKEASAIGLVVCAENGSSSS